MYTFLFLPHIALPFLLSQIEHLILILKSTMINPNCCIKDAELASNGRESPQTPCSAFLQASMRSKSPYEINRAHWWESTTFSLNRLNSVDSAGKSDNLAESSTVHPSFADKLAWAWDSDETRPGPARYKVDSDSAEFPNHDYYYHNTKL